MALGDTTYRGVMKQAAAFAVVPVTPSSTADLPDGVARGLLCDADKVLSVIDAGGETRVGVPFQKGYNWVAVRRVLTTGSPTGVWALY